MRESKMCFQDHTCRHCGETCKCETYTWACPWLNDDEEQLCSTCEKAAAVEEQVAYDTMSTEDWS